MANKVKERGTFSYLYEWARPYRSRYLLSVLFAVLEVGFGIIPFVCLGKITELLVTGEFAFTFGTYGMWLLIAALCWVGHYACHMVSTTISHKATFTVISDVRTNACNKLARMSLGDVLSRPSGEIKNTILERIDSIETTLAHIVPEVSSKLLAPIALFVYIMTIDWRVGLISLITIPVGFLMYACMMIGYKKKFERYVRAGKNLNSVAVEYINGIEVIKTFNQSADSYKKFTDAAYESAHSAIDWMKQSQIFFSIAMAVFPAVLLTVLPASVAFYVQGSVTLAEFVMLVVLSFGMLTPLIGIMSYSDDIGKISVIVGEINSILQKPELVRPKDKVKLTNYTVKGENVRFGYDEGKEILHGVNFEFRQGTVNALVGPSGSGKSTIAKLIASMWDVGSGKITIGGKDIREIPLEQLNQNIAYVAQDNFLFNESVRENIRKGNLAATDEEVENIAKASGCHEFIMKLENGYDTIVGPSGSGKSTIAKLIASMWDVGSGKITIGGKDIREIPLEQLNQNIAYVAQDNFLFNESVRENIRKGNLAATDEEVENIAKASGCHEFIMKLENGYDTIVGSSGGHLSGGERQRIAIARAMLKNAPVVILDEATAYTDPENEAVIQSAVSKLVQGKTLIVVAHRLSTIVDSDKIFLVNGGKIEASGTHEELLKSSALYNELWQAHVGAKDRVED